MAGRIKFSAEHRWPAPAKINLFLHVIGRRDDGYHLLQTVFRFVDFGDTLVFTPRSDAQITRERPLPDVPVEMDLVIRAARCLQQHCPQARERGVHIEVDKQLPMGGGLGGGSSDAATTLLALNQLWECGLDRQQLATLGLTLGADVPAFIHGRNTFATGIGECFHDLVLPSAYYILTMPQARLATAAVFNAPDLPRNTPPLSPEQWPIGDNDLELVACRMAPEIRTHLAWLRTHTPDAGMSGSGSCCFAAFADAAAAQAVLAQCPSHITARLVRGLDKHPLADL